MRHVKKRLTFLGILLLLFVWRIAPLFAQLTDQEVETDRYDRREQSKVKEEEIQIRKVRLRFRELALREAELEKKPSRMKLLLDKFDVSYGAAFGFDRNVRLDSTHKSSFYSDQDFGVAYKDKVGKWAEYKVDYSLGYIDYDKFDEEAVLDQEMGGEVDWKLHPTLSLESEYHYKLSSANNSQASYRQNEVKTGVKQRLIKDHLYHKPSFIYQHKGYTERKARFLRGTASVAGPDDRKDDTYRLDYEIGLYPSGKMFIRVNNQVGVNESNDEYRDFYDYDFYQVTAAVAWQISDRILTITGYRFQRNNYKKRDFSGYGAKENIHSFFGGVYFQLHRFVTWDFSGSYRETDNTLPELVYTDATFSTGLTLTL